KALVDSHPVEVNYKVMLGNWLMQNDRKGDAYKLFVEAVDADPDNEYALSSMYDYYRQAGKDSLAVSLRDRLLLSPKTAAKTKVTMLQQVINDNRAEGGDSTRMLALFDRMISANPRDTEAMILKSAYMSMVNMPADSIIHMQRQILAITPDNADSRLQLLQHLWPQKKWDEIVKESTQAIQYNPDEMAFYYFLGLAHYQQNDEDDALDAFRRGVGEITAQSDPGIVSDFYALMGDILHGKGKVEEAFAAYDSCLQWKEDNISCLNNYAYYLSVLGKNLTKAEEMSYRTVKAEPNNATYLDTYAWILYQQKRYAEARIYIDQAVKNDTDTVDVSAVVTEHAGDIYLMTGSTDEAVGFWQKAIERGGDKVALEAKIRKARSAKGKNNKDNSKRK
ncbi:MAG: tetratricopeptide repeat protein, partial [Prevotellaceae bacterium]|nr:tetratricopeptide repeat protein [Prevotellaceae bacterium]